MDGFADRGIVVPGQPREEGSGKAPFSPAQLGHPLGALRGGSTADGAKLAGDGVEPLRREELQAADEDAHARCRGGIDGERQHRLGDLAGEDVEDPQPVLEPAVPPGFDHRVGFLLVEPAPDEKRLEVAKQPPVAVVGGQLGPGKGVRAGAGLDHAVAGPVAAALEDDELAEHGRAIEGHPGLGERGRDRRLEGADAAIEEEALALVAARGAGLHGGGIYRARRIVVARRRLGRESSVDVRKNAKGAPVDAGGNGSRHRIPLGDRSRGEPHPHAHFDRARSVEIDDRRFHAHGPRQIALVPRIASQARGGGAEGVDESGEIARPVQRPPFDGAAVGAGDGGEGAPFVDDQRAGKGGWSQERDEKGDEETLEHGGLLRRGAGLAGRFDDKDVPPPTALTACPRPLRRVNGRRPSNVYLRWHSCPSKSLARPGPPATRIAWWPLPATATAQPSGASSSGMRPWSTGSFSLACGRTSPTIWCRRSFWPRCSG